MHDDVFEDDGDASVVWVDTAAERTQVLHKHMDYILRTLKNIPEHATPFLRPVTEKIAPVRMHLCINIYSITREYIPFVIQCTKTHATHAQNLIKKTYNALI